MAIVAQRVDPLASPEWDLLLEGYPDAGVFHTSAWARVLVDTYGYAPAYLRLHEDEATVGLAPFMTVDGFMQCRRGVSLPFSDYCQPLLRGGEAAGEYWKCLSGFAARESWRKIEIRGGDGLIPGFLPSVSYFRHSIDLGPGPDRIFRALRPGTRQGITKSQREGVRVEMSTDARALAAYYRLHCLTRKRQGMPPQPWSFFRNIQAHLIDRGMGLVCLAHYRDRAIAGAVYFRHGERVLYKFGASDTTFQHLRANNLVMWEAISFYAGEGLAELCLGRTDIDNQGLRRFKSGWGAKEEMISYCSYHIPEESFISEAALVRPWQNRLMRTLPIPVLRSVGKLLYRRAG